MSLTAPPHLRSVIACSTALSPGRKSSLCLLCLLFSSHIFPCSLPPCVSLSVVALGTGRFHLPAAPGASTTLGSSDKSRGAGLQDGLIRARNTRLSSAGCLVTPLHDFQVKLAHLQHCPCDGRWHLPRRWLRETVLGSRSSCRDQQAPHRAPKGEETMGGGRPSSLL